MESDTVFAIRFRSKTIAVISPVVIVVFDYFELLDSFGGTCSGADADLQFLHNVIAGYRRHKCEEFDCIFFSGLHFERGAEQPGIMSALACPFPENIGIFES